MTTLRCSPLPTGEPDDLPLALTAVQSHWWDLFSTEALLKMLQSILLVLDARGVGEA